MERLKRKLNTLVIEANHHDQTLIQLIRNTQALELVKHCQTTLQATEILGFIHTDLVFVNVDDCPSKDLPNLVLANPKAMFIWLTRDPNLKIEYLDPQVFDCLILPLSEARFQLTLRRIAEHFLLKNQKANPSVNQAGPTILVKSGGQQHQLASADIMYIESDGEYLKYHTKAGRYMALGSLRRLARNLSNDFVQVHRSYVVNRNYVLSKRKQQLEITGQRMIPIGKTYRNAFQFISSAVIL